MDCQAPTRTSQNLPFWVTDLQIRNCGFQSFKQLLSESAWKIQICCSSSRISPRVEFWWIVQREREYDDDHWNNDLISFLAGISRLNRCKTLCKAMWIPWTGVEKISFPSIWTKLFILKHTESINQQDQRDLRGVGPWSRSRARALPVFYVIYTSKCRATRGHVCAHDI